MSGTNSGGVNMGVNTEFESSRLFLAMASSIRIGVDGIDVEIGLVVLFSY